MNTIILGMGNTLLSDDGIGILIKRNLEKHIAVPGIDLVETNWGGFRIIDLLRDHDTAIIIDSIRTNQKPAGYVHYLTPENFLHTLRLNSYHDINFITALKLGKELKVKMPDDVHIFAVEITDNTTIAEHLDINLWKAVTDCSQTILELLKNKYNIQNNNQFPEVTPELIKELYDEKADVYAA